MSFLSFGNNREGMPAFTEDEARLLTWTRVLEESALENHEATVADFKEITSSAAREVGEQADFKKLLLTRANGVLDFLRSKTGRNPAKPQGIPYKTIGAVLGILAFVSGILTNEFTVSGNKINLLSPPLLAVIAWNIIVYIWIILAFFFNRTRTPSGPIRKGIAKLLLYLQTRVGRSSRVLVSFYSQWAPEEQSLLRYRVAEILHFSAMLFGLGLIASIGIHGWGTAYTVGWESTWLSNSPSAVLTFINLFYGLIPFNPDLFNHLTPQAVESMRFGAGPGESAAPWLLQLFYILSAVVILPRATLGFFACSRACYIKNHFPIDRESVYYSNILRQWRGKTMLIHVIPFSYPLTEKVKEGMQTLAGELHPENSKCIFSPAAHEDTKLPDFEGGEQVEAVALFAMTSTPEAEVQGNFLNELKKKAQSSDALLRVIVDTSGFMARFANTPQRINERKKNWSDFLSSYGVSFAFANLLDADAKEVAKQFEAIR